MDIIEFEFEGETYEANAAVKENYLFAYGIANAEDDMGAFFAAMDILFPEGRHMAYAKKMGGDYSMMNKLISAAVEAVGAKN